MNTRICAGTIASLSLFAIASISFAQTTSELTLNPWADGVFGETFDKILYQQQSHVKGEDNRNAQVFWWDSHGRFRVDKHDDDAFSVGYRYVTIVFDTNSKIIPDNLDDMN